MTKIAVFLMFLLSCNSSNTKISNATSESPNASLVATQASIAPAALNEDGELIKVVKSEDEWKEILNKEEFHILREQGTERSFSGDLWDNKKVGTYTCRACALPLFASETKFKSGTGWPSFYTSIEKTYVVEHVDNSYGMSRTEVVCGRCDGHLGHVFNDGPRPTGLRYCINSASLDFVEK